MGIIFLNPISEYIDYTEVDKEIAKFWNLEFDINKYSRPSLEQETWVWKICVCVTNRAFPLDDWDELISELILHELRILVYNRPDKTEIGLSLNVIDELKSEMSPYVKALTHLQNLGYTFKCSK
jgi:hypothetical protein